MFDLSWIAFERQGMLYMLWVYPGLSGDNLPSSKSTAKIKKVKLIFDFKHQLEVFRQSQILCKKMTFIKIRINIKMWFWELISSNCEKKFESL